MLPCGVMRSAAKLTFAALALVVGSLASTASAESLTTDENDRLLRGDTVTRPQTLENDAHKYVGGVAYSLVDGTESDLVALFDDVAAYRRILPHTTSARRVGVVDGDLLIELRQGSSIFEAAYTIRVHKDPTTRTVRFWLDRSVAHGIEDAWGYFRIEPTNVRGKMLLVYGALVDLGDGLARALFEERIRTALLGVPGRVRDYLSDTRVARR
jgi:ribosome-associated toxin RatA of RatAB toxin-antitoxin module